MSTVAGGGHSSVSSYSAAQASGTSTDPDDSVAAWSAKCYWVVNDQIDPVEDFGDPVSDHMHSFVGEPGPADDLTPATLRSDPVDDCHSPSVHLQAQPAQDKTDFPDRSEYWTPALKLAGVQPVDWLHPDVTLIYYRNAGVDPDLIVPFPQDYATMAGDPDASPSNLQPAYQIRWSCVAKKHTGSSDPHELNFAATIPPSCPKYLVGGDGTHYPFSLRLVVYFPNCVNFGSVSEVNGQWNPGHATDAEHYAEYISTQDEYKRTCDVYGGQPVSGFTPIPQVQVGFRWELDNIPNLPDLATDSSQYDLSTLMYASDMAGMGQAHGVSAHADFMSGWSDDQVAKLVENCFWTSGHVPPGNSADPRNCGTISVDDDIPPGEN